MTQNNLTLIYLIFFYSEKENENNFGFTIGEEPENDTSINSIGNKNKFITFIKKKHTNNLKIYDLDVNIDSKDEKNVIEEIKMDRINTIVFITKNNNLFTNFNRPIILIQKDKKNFMDFAQDEFCILDITMKISIEYLKNHNIELIISNINNILFKYGSVFNIEINLLIKETTYSCDNKNTLMKFINEDINMFKLKNILTSRLSIIIYRLFFFDLNAKATRIGNFYRKELNVKSRAYSFNDLNNNYDRFYFTDLINKSFRGYQIPLPKPIIIPSSLFDEKIKIAKRLLKSKVKIKVVSEALDIEESKLNECIFGEKGIKPKIILKESHSPFEGVNVSSAKPILNAGYNNIL